MAHTRDYDTLNRYVGVAVDVHYGGGVLPGKVVKVVPTKPDDRSVKVVFDDPMTYGGMGAGWFTPAQVSLPGQAGGLDG